MKIVILSVPINDTLPLLPKVIFQVIIKILINVNDNLNLPRSLLQFLHVETAKPEKLLLKLLVKTR